MAQIITMPNSVHPFYCPSSPDPTPLRLLAFSVAEAALQSDPNSPSIIDMMGKMPTPLEMNDWAAPSFSQRHNEGSWAAVGPWSNTRTAEPASQPRRPLWEVVTNAKERRERERSSPSSVESNLPQSPPVSPTGSYNFVLPPNSPLAASIAAGSSPSKTAKVPSSKMSKRFPLFTRSAEPSPTKSTFSSLDQTQPPPEFKPRLSAADFSAKAKLSANAAKHGRTKSDIGSPAASSDEIPAVDTFRAHSKLPMVPSRHTMRLPSLAQIQAKMTSSHQRGFSVPTSASGSSISSSGSKTQTETRTQSRPSPMIRTVYRTDSQESVEVIKTPTEETPRREARIVLASILNRSRPATPPSPPLTTVKEKEPRLAPFLRERTSGRLSGGLARPISMPPMSLGELPSFEAIVKANTGAAAGPAFKVTPPKERQAGVLAGNIPSPTKGSFPWTTNASGMCTPTEGRFNLSVGSTSTPPPRTVTPSPRRSFTSPASPTESVRSTATSSPSLSVPMITCTPAPQTVLRDGVEHDSDEEEGDVVLFEGDSMSVDSDSEVDAEEMKEREEREKRAEVMKKRLMLRRRSD